jgi:methionine--tRNA ligase beta chain
MSEPLPTIAYDLFAKIDFRVATVLSAEAHPNADKLLKIRLDDGTPEGRQVCAGIKAWYDPTTLIGKQVIIVANLEPRQLRGEISAGMILAASDLKELAVVTPDVAAVAADGQAAVAAAAAAAKPEVKPEAKPGPDERNVVLLTVEKPVKAGSKVS